MAISRAAWPDGAQNTSEAASNKLNRKFRLRLAQGHLGPGARPRLRHLGIARTT